LNFKHKVLSLGSCDMKLTSFCWNQHKN
jgi:hypothetical protein